MLRVFTAFCFLSAGSCFEPLQSFYKISMVSSDESPGKPALFVHGRSAVWDVDRQSLFFVDSIEQNVHRLDYVSGKIHTKNIDFGSVNVISLVAASKRLVVASRAALYILDWGPEGNSALRPLTALDLGQPDNVINTGQADHLGRYWAVTQGLQTSEHVLQDRGALYTVDQLSLWRPAIQLKPVTSVGGMAWAANNSVLYISDSQSQLIEAFDYDSQRGEISGRRTIVDVTVYGYEDAYPEGMTVDSRGRLWVALMGAGTILHIDPDKRHVIFGYKLPVSLVTSVAWGGPRLDELFVTTARDLLHEGTEPYSGAIFTIRDTGSVGVPANRFFLNNADQY